MRITRDFGITSSRLEHDLLVRLNRDIIVAHRNAIENISDDKRNRHKGYKTAQRRKYTHVWKENLNNDY